MRARFRSTALDCGIAVGGVALALLVRQMLERWLGDNQPFFTFYLAILFAAWFGGVAPAALTLGLGALAADYFFIARRHSLLMHDFNDISGMLLYCVVGMAAIAFSEATRLAQRRAEHSADQVRQRQAELEREIAQHQATEQSLQ